MQELVELTLEDGRLGGAARRGSRRSVRVNIAESPLGWLFARSLVTPRQHEAGERLRGDHERAALGVRVTMRWDVTPRGRGGAERIDPAAAQICAKQRFDAALSALGSGLQDVAWRVICAGEGLPVAEKGLGWPVRSGRIVLGLALDRLADHYRLP